MGFINNYTDSFLPSSHPWDKVEHQKYEYIPKPKDIQIDVAGLSYDQLSEMIGDMSAVHKTLPNCPQKSDLNHKMTLIAAELQQRDDIENIIREERDDPFEKQPIKETVKYKKEVYLNEENADNTPIEPPPIEEPIEADLDGDIDLYIEEVNEGDELGDVISHKNLNNFLIASLIIITLFSLMGNKKNRRRK